MESINEAIKNNQAELQTFIADSKKSTTEVKEFMIDINDQFNQVNIRLDQISSRLGIGPEGNVADLLKFVLKSEVAEDVKDEKHKTFKDLDNSVNENSSEFKVDVFSEKPLVAVECSSYTGRDEFPKIAKMLRMRKFLENRYGGHCRLIYATDSIDPEIASEFQELCRMNQIQFITRREMEESMKMNK